MLDPIAGNGLEESVTGNWMEITRSELLNPIAGNGGKVITYSMAWQWVCMALEMQELVDKLPDAKMYWRTDTPDILCIRWLHDCSKPEQGYVVVWSNLTNQSHHFGTMKVLEAEIKRYQSMKELIGWRLPYMNQCIADGTW